MPRGKKELAEQIIPKLREVEVEVGRGKTVLTPVNHRHFWRHPSGLYHRRRLWVEGNGRPSQNRLH
jgi:hypothetical protein